MERLSSVVFLRLSQSPVHKELRMVKLTTFGAILYAHVPLSITNVVYLLVLMVLAREMVLSLLALVVSHKPFMRVTPVHARGTIVARRMFRGLS